MRSPRATPSTRGDLDRSRRDREAQWGGHRGARGRPFPKRKLVAELDPDFDWNGEIVIGADAPIAEIERATGISDDEPLA